MGFLRVPVEFLLPSYWSPMGLLQDYVGIPMGFIWDACWIPLGFVKD